MQQSSATSTAILDATLVVLTRSGLAKLALEDVADEAGVSRQTVYRHFGSRDGLIAATVVREEEELLGLVREAAEGVTDLGDAIRLGLAAALHGAADHPLLQRLLESEPEALLPFLTLGTGPVLSIIGPAVSSVVVERRPDLAPDDLEFLGDAIGRVVVSFAVAPRPDVDDTAARLAQLVVHHVDALVTTGAR